MKRILTILIIIIFGFASQPYFVFSAPEVSTAGNKEEVDTLNQKILEKKAKIKEIEKSIEAYKKKITQKRLESVSLSNQIGLLDNRLKQIELDIEVTEARIETINLEIEQLALAIEDKEELIERQKEILAEFIRTLHFENDKKFIEILAAYDSFSDFYNRVRYLQKIEKDLNVHANSLKLAKVDLEDKKLNSENKKGVYEDLEENLEDKKKDVEEQTFAKHTVLAQSQSSELQYKTLVNNLRSQYQEIEGEISGIEQEVRKRLESSDSFATDPDDPGILSWPTQSRYITAQFHDPGYPYRHVFEHNAVDIRAAQGTTVRAVASGYMARVKNCFRASCYAYAMIVHSGGISTVYGHLSKIVVQEDQFVTRGDIIGYSGARPGTIGAGPFTTGPHLHFEVRKNGIPVNPLSYLVKDY